MFLASSGYSKGTYLPMPRLSRRQTSAKIRLANQEKNNPGSGIYLKEGDYTRRADSGTDSEWADSGSDGGHEDTESESGGAEYDKDDDIWHPLQVFISRLQHEEAEPAPKKNWEGSGNSERSIQRRRKQAREKRVREMEWRRTNPAITSFFQLFLRARRNTTQEMAAMATSRRAV